MALLAVARGVVAVRADSADPLCSLLSVRCAALRDISDRVAPKAGAQSKTVMKTAEISFVSIVLILPYLCIAGKDTLSCFFLLFCVCAYKIPA